MAGGRIGRQVLDGQLLLVLALLAGLAAAAWLAGGSERVAEGLGAGVGLLLRFGLLIVVSLLAAGFAEVLVPRHLIEGALGAGSGLRGILLGTAAGAVTPAGPFVSLPIAAVLLRSGAGTGAVVAFVAGWSLLAFHRLVAWEVPILGWRFALLRWTACLVLPVLAGLAAAALVRLAGRA
jgi:uncharacterized membrane protein YraQ (UPF0718 family)